MTKVDLDRISLTQAAVAAWHAMCERLAAALAELNIPPTNVGTEELWQKDDGSLELRVQAGPLSVKMDVPPEHWRWRQNN